MKNVVLHADSIAKAYKSKMALHPTSFTLEKGKVYGLAGPNGSGKSTLMGILAGNVLPDVGYLNIVANSTVGHMHNEHDYPPYLTIGDIATLFENSQKDWIKERFDEVLAVFELRKNQKYGSLSTGQKAGVKLAVLVAQKTDIWLLDEATLGVDIARQSQCLTVLLNFFAEDSPAVVYCSHDMGEIDRLADDVWVINEGKIVWQGTKAEFAKSGQSVSESLLNKLEMDKVPA